MESYDREFMEMAVEAARKCQGEPKDPMVGAVAALDGELLGVAHRSEFEPGDHAEFTLLERHLKGAALAGATIYTTLEPCTHRNPPKISCSDRLIRRKVGRVVIGMVDPNPIVSGFGCRKLRQGNITADLFPPDLMSKVEELNRDFINAIEDDVITCATSEIATLSTRSATYRQREAIGKTLRGCIDSLKEIRAGKLLIEGREAGYFQRLLDRLEQAQQTEYLRAYVRLSIFRPEELLSHSWFANFYSKLEIAANQQKVRVEYIFLLRSDYPTDVLKDYLSLFERFAHRICAVYTDDNRLDPTLLYPNMVLFETQKVAFTHDRNDALGLKEAYEWILEDDFRDLQNRYAQLELLSTPLFEAD